MGEPVPDSQPPWPPVLDPEKYYCVSVLCWQNPEWDPLCFVGDRCEGEAHGPVMCCQVGETINGWWNAGGECMSCMELCMFTGYSAQKIIGISGPYDTGDECREICHE